MSKQLIIYDNIQPLSNKHAGWSVNIESYDFVANLNSVPLLANEIVQAAVEYPIVFSATNNEGGFVPLAVMGLKEDQNLLLDDKNLFVTRYVPAFVRRYPFVLGTNKDSDLLSICIDEGSKACLPDGSKGFRLFDDKGERSAHLNEVIEFLKDYQTRAEVSGQFCSLLHKLDLLEPMQANISFKHHDAANVNLTGFYVVKREKLKALKDEDALELFKKDGLELIYAHLQSLANFNTLIDLMSKQLDAAKA
ncbi:MAG TPA: SapC family protein [Cellvibrio sp.]|nr:SapC family protein [Cellvibrio sp.]